MSMSSAIVGGGSVGLLSAKKLLDSNQISVSLFDSSTLVGGITRDFHNSKGDAFFAGCQYLDPEYIHILNFASNLLVQFPHTYSSLTNVGESWLHKSDFAGPSFPRHYFRGKRDLGQQSKAGPAYSLHERNSMYPLPIAEWLYQFCSRFGDQTTLHESGAIPLGLSRVASFEDDHDSLILKQRSELDDSLFGVSRATLGLSELVAFLPSAGYSQLWDYMLHALRTNPAFEFVKLKVNRDSAFSHSAISNAHEKIWTADPRYLVRRFTGGRLESLTSKKFLYGFKVEIDEPPTGPHYINVFSHSTPISRLFMYTLGPSKDWKITIESTGDLGDHEDVTTESLRLLQLAGFRVRPFGSVAVKSGRQYHPLSCKDMNTLNDLEERMAGSGWVRSGLALFDRSSKVKRILSDLEERARGD